VEQKSILKVEIKIELLNRLKEKRQLKGLLESEKSNALNAFSKWNNMLFKKSKIIVLEANSSEELSQKWDEFYYSINDGRGRLGSLWSIDDKKFSVNDEKQYLMIHYTDFSLRDGFSTEEYSLALSDYEQINDRVQDSKQMRVKRTIDFDTIRILIFLSMMLIMACWLLYGSIYYGSPSAFIQIMAEKYFLSHFQ